MPGWPEANKNAPERIRFSFLFQSSKRCGGDRRLRVFYKKTLAREMQLVYGERISSTENVDDTAAKMCTMDFNVEGDKETPWEEFSLRGWLYSSVSSHKSHI